MASVAHAPPKRLPGKLLSKSESLLTRKSIRKLLLPSWAFTKKLLLVIPVPLVWWWKKLQERPTVATGILITVIGGAFFGSAGIARVVAPSKELRVAPFEISPAASNTLGMDGKSLTNIFVDELQNMIEKADSFSGNSNSSHKMYNRLPDSPHIPVQTTFGIEFQGISLDQMVAIWHRVRYRQYLVSGDIVTENQAPKVGGAPATPSIVYARYTRAGEAKMFEWPGSDFSPTEIRTGLHELAVKMLFALDPEIPIRYFESLAWECKEKCVIENSQKAVDLATEWIGREPHNARAFYFLGYALDHLSRWADACVAFDRSIALDPDFYLGWHGKGFCLLDQGLWEQSKAPINRALAIRRSSFLENNLGLAFYNQGNKNNKGDFYEAMIHYRRAITLDPDLDDAYSNLGQALLHLDKNAEAVTVFQEARQINVRDYDTLAYLVIAMIRAGKSEADIDNQANLASLLAPKAWEPHWVKGIISLEQHHPQTALTQFNAALEVEKTVTVCVEIARAKRMAGDQEGAKSALEMALSLDEDNKTAKARAHHLLGVILRNLGDPQAKYHLDAADLLDPYGRIEFPQDE